MSFLIKCKICRQTFTEDYIIDGVCKHCIQAIKNSFHYGIGGKEVGKKVFDRVVKRGYLIPEEIEDVRLEEENEKSI